MTPPRVSVITIFLDAERFLAEAIDSVFRQSFGDWELILVDDGSRDGSAKLADQAGERAPDRVRLLEHPGRRNLGMSASRNRGLDAARGELITFLDADDTWEPSKLARQVELLAARPEAAGLVAPATYWYSWSSSVEDRNRDFSQRWPLAAGRIVDPPVLLDMFLADEWMSLCDVLLRRLPVLRIGGYEDLFAGMYEDQAFHAKLCSAYSLLVDDQPVYNYRQHADSCTLRSHAGGATGTARLRFLEWLEHYLLEHGFEGGATLELVRQQHRTERAAQRPADRWWRRWPSRRSDAPAGSS